MKKHLFVLVLVFCHFGFSQFHHGVSFRRTNKGTAINYSLANSFNVNFKSIYRAGIHIENIGSGFTTDPNSYDLIEVPQRQITYVPISGELDYTLFRDSMENNFLPLVCVEFGATTGMGRLENTFKNKYTIHTFSAIGLGAEFSGDQKYQLSVRYFHSDKFDGNILIDLTLYWK